MGAAKQTQASQRRLRMQTHANAKTTWKTRELLVQRVMNEGWTYREAASAASISVRTVAKWIARYRVEGRGALSERRSRPRRSPRATPPRVISTIIRYRQSGLPAWQIARRVGRPRSTVGTILRRVGLGRLRRPTPRPLSDGGPSHPWQSPGALEAGRLGVCACRHR